MLRPHIAAAGLQVLDPAGVRKRRDEPVPRALGRVQRARLPLTFDLQSGVYACRTS